MNRKITVGSHPKNTYVVRDRAVAPVHLIIYVEDKNKCRVEDQQTRTGTYVNGKKINQHWLAPGDVIQIGFQEIPWEALVGQSGNMAFEDTTQTSSALAALSKASLPGEKQLSLQTKVAPVEVSHLLFPPENNRQSAKIWTPAPYPPKTIKPFSDNAIILLVAFIIAIMLAAGYYLGKEMLH